MINSNFPHSNFPHSNSRFIPSPNTGEYGLANERGDLLDRALVKLKPHNITAHSVLAGVDGQVVVDRAVGSNDHSVRCHGVAGLGVDLVAINVRHLGHLVDLQKVGREEFQNSFYRCRTLRDDASEGLHHTSSANIQQRGVDYVVSAQLEKNVSFCGISTIVTYPTETRRPRIIFRNVEMM